MRNTRFLPAFCLAALVAVASNGLHPKQLAGPPSDFLTDGFGKVNPEDTAIRSKSALLPVSLTRMAGDTYTWRGDVAVDLDGAFSMMVFSGNDETWDIQLRPPNAKRYMSVHELYSSYKQTEYGIEQEKYPGEHFSFDHLSAGTWSMKIVADAPRSTRGFLLYGTTGPYRLKSYKQTPDTLVGEPVTYVARAFDAALNRDLDGVVTTADLLVTDPYGTQQRLAMFDDGRHGDGLPGDGLFGADFTPMEVGTYQVSVLARGTTPEGTPFLRTSEHLAEVRAPELIIDNDLAVADQMDDVRLSVNLNVTAFDDVPRHYRVYAEVWGRDAAGADLPVNWIGGMVQAVDGRLSLGLDSRWIALAGARAPFELRNVRIEDPDSFTAMARAETMALVVPRLPEAAHAKVNRIDESMLMGPRPAIETAGKAGHTLMVVHGYCSGDVWGGNMGNFSSATKFQDFNKNRSHDAFAQRIMSQGSGFTGYGIVAHSQGGCAALHLYTYYWSGLDNTTSGSRKIQSVGTPYQGTSLAGNLAAIGEVFGAGCGTNYDLTYDGASSWLSGIPSWARAEVNFYTTSFTDKWYRYDYCHLATDLFLDDPEDGTTEKSKGQLSGGVNRGHKTGWCHTNSMRDPGQCTDSGRNSTMSSYAER